MDEVAGEFVNDILNAFVATSADAADAGRPLFVALAGVPGSGKSTLARMAADMLNAQAEAAAAGGIGGSQVVGSMGSVKLPDEDDEDLGYKATGPATDIRLGKCFVLGMDGYHMTRAELDAMGDPEEAHRRRGAHWTFDANKLYKDLAQLKNTGQLSAPTFDHATRDPTPNAIDIDARTVTRPVYDDDLQPIGADVCRCIVIVEGLYLAMQDLPSWERVNGLFDLVAFLQCDAGVAVERLVQRHMTAWGVPRDEALARASGSDAENAALVETTAINAHVVFDSVPDDTVA
uniref:Phosphoribulokinase/uridine kinase domain-containing protein n=1 Tax=Neobodo designis TaxID=312471 RepID=A0A7S1QPB7_NEODS|mmetsp:Transcript_49624/g.153261  ORF Transcript_49624/g.153261 Transcript_49624/m.153261 type:complete len:290 (+) Transcript_49624:178-1047(+)